MVKGLILIICCFIQSWIGYSQLNKARIIFDEDLLNKFVSTFPKEDKICFYENSIYSSEVYEVKSILLLTELKLHNKIYFYDDIFDVTEIETAKLNDDSDFHKFILNNDYKANNSESTNPFLTFYFTIVLNKYQENQLHFIGSIRPESLCNGSFIKAYVDNYVSDTTLNSKLIDAFKIKSDFSKKWSVINNSILSNLDKSIDTSSFQYKLFYEVFSFYNACENLNEISQDLLEKLNLKVDNLTCKDDKAICVFKNYSQSIKSDNGFTKIAILYGNGKIKNKSYTYKFNVRFKSRKLNQYEFLKLYTPTNLEFKKYIYFDQNQNSIVKSSTDKLSVDYFLIIDSIGKLEDVFYVYR